jgi:hypothetical protein
MNTSTASRWIPALALGLFAAAALALPHASSAQSGWVLVDDFDSYNTGNVNANPNPTGGVWTAMSNSQFSTIAEQEGNKFISYGWSNPNGFRGAYRSLGTSSLQAEEVATYFFQFRANVANPDHSFGLTDLATPAENFDHFRLQLAVVADPANPGKVRLGARQASGLTEIQNNLDVGSWFNVWLVVNNATNSYNAYFSADPMGTATLVGQDMTFRIGTTNALSTLLLLGRTASSFTGSDRGLHIDNIYYSQGTNLVNPIPEPATYALIFGVLALAGVVARRRRGKE